MRGTEPNCRSDWVTSQCTVPMLSCTGRNHRCRSVAERSTKERHLKQTRNSSTIDDIDQRGNVTRAAPCGAGCGRTNQVQTELPRLRLLVSSDVECRLCYQYSISKRRTCVCGRCEQLKQAIEHVSAGLDSCRVLWRMNADGWAWQRTCRQACVHAGYGPERQRHRLSL